MTTTLPREAAPAPSPAAVRPRRRRRPAKTRVASALRVIAIIAVLLFFLVPFAWMVMASMKTSLEITDPSKLLNFTPTIDNFVRVFDQQNFLPYIFNSFWVGFASTALSILLGVPAAYVLARFSMKRSAGMVLVARIIPGVSLLVPWYYVFSNLGLVGSFTVLIISHMFVSLPLIVWIMMSFFEGLPLELEEAAEIDGLTPIGAFLRITLPLSTPGIATAGILAFIFSWNNFLFALTLASDQTRTLPLALFNFVGYAAIDWGGLMAASVVITIPVIVVALFTQKYIVSGLSAGATKG
ncbi:carbohydrate ABC transporter permease [Mycetocola spongiae]|uniref:carbohydrate ABC transporter permease n=1 Tax=Mycetocola spongiae TaxID=2859226 RepID=UPI001CF15CEA|nr:carbohydrate ABC transporter permease [Mycetocola spongiae]UCR88643.1 carbohydrate ABC transporter permease [Mycetocola spongiae]